MELLERLFMQNNQFQVGGRIIPLENNIITNPYSGETIQFVNTEEKDTLNFKWSLAKDAEMPFGHVHRVQAETFTVVNGRCVMLLGKTKKIIDEGQTFTVEPGQVHRPTNPSSKPLEVLVKVEPALSFRINVETIFGLASEHRCNKRGKPYFWHMVAIHYGYPHHYRPDVPMVLQDIFSSTAGPLLSLAGIKSCYKKFSKGCEC